MLGVGAFDFSALNDRLTANGYQKLPSTRTLIGGEGHAVFDSGFVVGARGGAFLGGGADGPGGMRARFSGGFGMLDLGFALVHTKPILLTLTADIGGYGSGLEISDGQSFTFDDALKNPKRSVSMGRGGVLMGITIGIDGRVPIGQPEHGRRGFFTLGARIGALYGPSLGDFSSSGGAQATNGPTTGLAGVYGALAIGFGGGRIRPSDGG